MEREEQAIPDLRILFWETTAVCNLFCRHCRVLPDEDEPRGELSTRDAFAFLDRLAEDFSPLLILSGGEPLCRPDIFEIASHARDKGLPVALATNATLVNEGVARRIRDCGIRRVSISLDGPNASVHDSFRGFSGSFDAAVSGLKKIQAVGVSTQINTTVTRHNLDFLPETLEFALDLGVDALHIFCLVPVGCGMEIAEDQQISPQKYEEALRWLFEKSLEVGIHLKATCAPHYYRIMRQLAPSGKELVQGKDGPHGKGHGGSTSGKTESRDPGGGKAEGGEMSAVTKGCLAGQSVCFISHSGEVFPCGYLPLSSGNVREQSLAEIWRRSPIFKSLRDPSLLKGKCGICEYKLVCQGCRARAYGCTGDFLAEEPYCTYQPRSGGR